MGTCVADLGLPYQPFVEPVEALLADPPDDVGAVERLRVLAGRAAAGSGPSSNGDGTDEPEHRRELYDGAVDKGEKGWDPRYGNGLLDANAALLAGAGEGIGSRGVATSGVRLALAGALTALAGASLRRRRAPLPPLGVPFLLG